MNWGGLIAGALGGGAQAVGQIADGAIAARQREEQDMRLEQRQMDGEKRRSLLNREEAAAAAADKLKGEEDRMKRYAKSADEVDARAKQIGTERDAKALQIPDGQYGPQVTPEVVDTFSKGQRANYESQGVLTKPTGSGLVMDKINAAREVGADPMLRKDLKDEYGQQVGAEFKADQAGREERKLDQRDIKMENDRVAAERRADALFAKISNGNGKGEKGDTDQWLKLIGEQRKGYKDDLAQLRNDRQVAVAAEPNPKKKQDIIARFDAQIVGLKSKSDEIDSKIDAVTSRLLDKPNAPKMEGKSTPAQSKPDANSALSDARRAIQKNPANRDEVVRRLKAAGIDTKGL